MKLLLNTQKGNLTCDGILDTVNHSAKGFRVQSQDKGLSCNDRLCNSLAPFKAFLATMDMSLPSNRNSRSEGRGAIRSLVKALKVNKINCYTYN